MPASNKHEKKTEINWKNVRPTWQEVTAGCLGLSLWLFAFGVGLLVPTITLRQSISATIQKKGLFSPEAAMPSKPNLSVSFSVSSAASVPVAAPATAAPPDWNPYARDNLDKYHLLLFGGIVLIGYTVSNVCFLCLFASFLGCMARRWSTPFEIWKAGSTLSPDEQIAMKDMSRAYTTAMLRGFLAYLLFIAGYLIVVPENSLGQLTPGQYARLAGGISSLAFLVGFEPRMISRLLKLVFVGDEGGDRKEQPPAGSKDGGGAQNAATSQKLDAYPDKDHADTPAKPVAAIIPEGTTPAGTGAPAEPNT
jgi:hypothetical protein